jgi:hypothetical protein
VLFDKNIFEEEEEEERVLEFEEKVFKVFT